jgi:hypothetical protein
VGFAFFISLNAGFQERRLRFNRWRFKQAAGISGPEAGANVGMREALAWT